MSTADALIVHRFVKYERNGKRSPLLHDLPHRTIFQERLLKASDKGSRVERMSSMLGR